MRKQLQHALGVMLLASALAGQQASAADEQPVRGGTFIYGIAQGEPATLDCQMGPSINIALRTAPHYSTLVKNNPANQDEIIGDLAQSWTVSPDGLTYTFKLHPNILFHDGTPLTSEDVRVSLDRIRKPPQGMFSPRQSMFTDIDSVEAPAKDTVVLKLSKPNTSMLTILSSPNSCILSAALLKSDPNYPDKKVMGSGPFKFVKYTPGYEWEGARFDGYFIKGRPYLDGFRALSLTTPASVAAMSAGQTMTDFRGVAKSDADRIKAARGDKVQVYSPDNAINLLLGAYLNTKNPALADPRVRKALALALDHWGGEKLVERSTGTSAPGGLLRPGSQYARTPEELSKLTGFSRDINAARAEARKLLAEAGQSDLKLRLLNRKPFPYVGVFFIDQFRQIGVTLTQDQPEDPQYFARRAAGDYDLVTTAMPDASDDPTTQWIALLSYSQNAINASRADDPKIDAYYDRQKRESDPKARKAILQEAEAYALDQAYLLPFFWGKRTIVMSSQVGGYSPTSSNWIGMDLGHLWLRK